VTDGSKQGHGAAVKWNKYYFQPTFEDAKASKLKVSLKTVIMSVKYTTTSPPLLNHIKALPTCCI